TFANDWRKGRAGNERDAALAAGMTRLRPVIMTALAMIIGMLPMSLGLGEGGEQNAPLGRAVIGGLAAATLATLFCVPVVYAALLALAALLLVGLIPRHRQEQELRADAAAAVDAPVPVNVVRPRRSEPVVNLPLPGTLRPWQEVSLFARTNGYLKKYYVDISN